MPAQQLRQYRTVRIATPGSAPPGSGVKGPSGQRSRHRGVETAVRTTSQEVAGVLPQLAVTWWSWSALGPHDIGNRWSSAGTSGHSRHARIPGHPTFTATTSAGDARWRRVRTPHLTAACPNRTLACEASRAGYDTTELEPQGDDEIGRTSLHDPEGKVRHPSTLDHPRALQVDRSGAEVVEQ
jgi:hypothetical protein